MAHLKRKLDLETGSSFSILADIDENNENHEELEVVGGRPRQLKKKAKKEWKVKQKKIENGTATKEDYYDLYGDQIRPSFEFKVGTEDATKKKERGLHCWDLQALILSILMPSTVSVPRFIKLENKVLFSKIVMIHLDGFSTTIPLIAGNSKLVSSDTDIAEKSCGVTLNILQNKKVYSSLFDSNSVAQAMLTVNLEPLTNTNKKKSKPNNKEIIISEQVSQNNDNVAITDGSHPSALFYCLHSYELESLKFPINVDGYVTTTGSGPNSLIAIDCEMCRTENGLELTRISLVNDSLKCIYNSLVLPEAPITDYCTQYSGINAETLQNVTKRLADVQEDILKLISADTILVGHSLENDLNAMKMCHFKIIDTSVVYPHPRGLPYRFALKNLADKYLQKAIQTNSAGHDSIEDAIATMQLALLKIKNGPSFGVGLGESENMCSLLARNRKQVSMVAYPDFLQSLAPSAISVIPCYNDGEILAKAIKECNSNADFIFIQFRELANAVTDGSKTNTINLNVIQNTAAQLNSQLESLEAQLPRDSLVIYTTGQFPSLYIKNLLEKKHSASKNGYIWTELEENKLKSFMEMTKNNFFWMNLKD